MGCCLSGETEPLISQQISQQNMHYQTEELSEVKIEDVPLTINELMVVIKEDVYLPITGGQLWILPRLQRIQIKKFGVGEREDDKINVKHIKLSTTGITVIFECKERDGETERWIPFTPDIAKILAPLLIALVKQ